MGYRWLLAALCIAGCGDDGGTTSDAAIDTIDAFQRGAGPTVNHTMLGAPTWTIEDWRLYVKGQSDSLTTVWPHHYYNPQQNLVVPGPAHAGPYDIELEMGIAAAQFPTGSEFLESDWQQPRILIIAAAIVPTPDAPVGSSADSASGPIVANAALPLHINGDLLKDTTVVDGNFDSTYPSTPTFDGYSHIPLDFGKSVVVSQGTAGSYTFRASVTDSAGNGWTDDVLFTVR